MELTAEMVYKESMNTLAVQLADKTVEATTYRLLSDSLSEVIQTATNHLLNSELTPEQAARSRGPHPTSFGLTDNFFRLGLAFPQLLP
jgi:hypothetical protein